MTMKKYSYGDVDSIYFSYAYLRCVRAYMLIDWWTIV
jgi:hypothetical protein